MAEDIPPEIKEFLRSYVSSVGQLDILFLLYRDPSAVWSPAQISRELRSNPSLAERQVNELSAKGLLELTESGARCCRDENHLQAIEKLKAFFALRSALVIEFIYSQPLDQIRAFADAFRLKKD